MCVLHVCMYVYELKEVIIQYKRSYNNLQMKVKTQFFSFKIFIKMKYERHWNNTCFWFPKFVFLKFT